MAEQTKDQVKKNLETLLGGGVTQAQLNEWKEKYGEVSVVKVTVSATKELTGYFKKPTRDIMAYCINAANNEKVYEAREFLVTNTFIGGDKEITTDYDASLAAQISLWRSINFLKAEVTKY